MTDQEFDRLDALLSRAAKGDADALDSLSADQMERWEAEKSRRVKAANDRAAVRAAAAQRDKDDADAQLLRRRMGVGGARIFAILKDTAKKSAA